MKGLALAVSLAFLMSAGSAFAQATGQPAPASQAPQAPLPAPRAPVPTPTPSASPQPPAPFPEGAKIAFVDFQRIAQESVEGQNAASKINALIQKKQVEGAEKVKQLQVNQQKLQQSGGVMSDAARSQLEKEIERQQRENERFQQDAQAEINELTQELQGEFQKKIMPLVQQVFQEKGLQLLLSRADAGIVSWNPGLDLTPEVVKKLDAITPKPTAAAPAASPATPGAPKK